MWIEDNFGLFFAACLFGWIVVGTLVAIVRNAIDADCATDNVGYFGMRVLVWPLELFILFFQILFLVVGVLAIAIVRILTCKF
jgi:hypothetical protein